MASILKSILAKPWNTWTEKESGIIGAAMKHCLSPAQSVLDCLSFILGNENPADSTLQAYFAARTDFSAGAALPPEVIEGIRARYHPSKTKGDVLELTKRKMTTGQKIAVQKSAAKSNVQVEFDPKQYDPTQLYIYAFEMGMTDEISNALHDKASSASNSMPFRLGKTGIIVDTSESMRGHGTQAFRPISRALAMRDLFSYASDASPVVRHTTNGEVGMANLVRPGGNSKIAPALVDVIQQGVDSVVIISDGYENAPAGRTAEVIDALRGVGISTPIYQVSPVAAAEVAGVRKLADDITVLPVSDNVKSIGIGMARILLESDFPRGIQAMMGVSIPLLAGG